MFTCLVRRGVLGRDEGLNRVSELMHDTFAANDNHNNDDHQKAMPKDYWQPEDVGRIEETEGFPLPPVDAEGKNLDYVWVPSKSLSALSAACKRMSGALVGAEVISQILYSTSM